MKTILALSMGGVIKKKKKSPNCDSEEQHDLDLSLELQSSKICGSSRFVLEDYTGRADGRS